MPQTKQIGRRRTAHSHRKQGLSCDDFCPRPGVKRLDTKQAADNHSPDGGRPGVCIVLTASASTLSNTYCSSKAQ